MVGDVLQQTQAGSATGVEAQTVALESAPTPGSLLISGISVDEKAGPIDQGTSGYPTPSEGWEPLAADSSSAVSVGFAYRVADGGPLDACTWTWEEGRPHECAGWILEVEPGDGDLTTSLEVHYTDGLKYPTMSFGPLAVAGGNGIAVAMVGAGTASSVADGPTLGSWDGGFEEQIYFHEPDEAENAGGSLAYKGVTDGEVIETTMTATDKTEPESQLSGILAVFTWPAPEPAGGSIIPWRESPPDTMEFIVRDGPGGAPIARWAEDAVRDEDVLSNIRLRGQVPGGRKEATGTLPRDPRRPGPDIRSYADVDVQGPGRQLLWSGRFSKSPQSDSEYVSIDGVCVGWQAALSDRKGVRVGIIDPALGRIGGITAQRRKGLLEAAWPIDVNAVSTSVDQYGSGPDGNRPAGLTFAYSEFREVAEERGELMYDSGGPSIGAIYYDFEGRFPAAGEDTAFLCQIALSPDGVNAAVASSPYHTASAPQQAVSAGGVPGLRYAIFTSAYGGAGELTNVQDYRFANIVVLGLHGLAPVGTWPNIGLTKKQVFPWLIPEIAPALEVSEDSIDDDGWVIQDAWYPEPGEGADIVHDLMRTSVLDWFVQTGRLFEIRVPGTYGRRWKATIASSGFVEDGIDSERLWRSITGSYTDEAGVTRYVGPPGSGADYESPLLEITDPNHPAVQAEIPREDLLQLSKVSTPERAIEACAEWLKHANELPRSGRAVLSDHVMDQHCVFRPTSQVGEGDSIEFTDARGSGARKIVDYDYSRDERSVTIAVDAPSDSLQALNERYGAVLGPLGV